MDLWESIIIVCLVGWFAIEVGAIINAWMDRYDLEPRE